MLNIISGFIGKFSSDDTLRIQDMDMDELREERSKLKADMELKRDKHTGLAEKRRAKFQDLQDASDELMKEELAEEIASIEDEMSIYHNEHAQLMDALRVVDGLIAVKRKQDLMEDRGIVNELEDMDREEVVQMLKREDVQEMIKREKWDDLEDLFRGELKAQHSGSERVQEIINAAEEHEDKHVDEALYERDRGRQEKIEVE